ncbi:zinc-dependent alcohol dehydrogenase [Litoribacillus peritrichatus]|uniref:Alcohol dehydrogenase family protein n=1 Tax=Litoribacillus peritrichatus TaxID=718191 RepID=A0ABP7N6I2_9GAMM
MRSLFFEGINQVGWRDIKEPQVMSDHEVLVQTIAASTCYVDNMIISGKSPFEPPFAIGHESVARIIDKGEAVTEFEIGDVVAVPYHRSCGECPSCSNKKPLNCDSKQTPLIPAYGMPDGENFGGMFTERYRVPYADHALIKIPDGLDPISAVAAGDTLTDAWSTVVPHVRNKPEAKVLITSNAGYGLYAVQWAIAAGAGLVTYVDDDPTRLAVASELGASTVVWVDGIELPPIYDVIVNERQGAESLRLCLLAAAPGAVCENVVIFFEDVPIPIGQMHYSGVTLRSSFCPSRNYMPEVIQDLANGMINPRLVESEIVALEDVPKRFVLPSHKPIVLFEETPE